MPRGRPPLSVFLIDLPSDHEVDDSIVTECQVVQAILHNRGFKTVIKSRRLTAADRFFEIGARQYKGLGFVHIAGHGSRRGIELVGGTVDWPTVASTLKQLAPRLKKNQRRVLTLSCCHSEHASKRLSQHLVGHFTGIYFFLDRQVLFADTMTTFAMFYRRKLISKPHRKIVDIINEFFEREMIAFTNIP